MLRVRLSAISDGQSATQPVVALLDSGATRCMFSSEVSERLGLDLRSGIPASALGIGGAEDVWLHEVNLHLPGGMVTVQAGFQPSLPVAGLLGMTGFFEHFRITFDAANLQCEFERIFKP
jgi:hypothetical protein